MLGVLDYVFIGSLSGTTIWGVTALIIGCILRFDLGHFMDSFTDDVDTKFYSETSKNMLVVSNELGDANLGEWSLILGSLLITIGFLILGFSTAGFLAVLLNNATALFASVGLILVAFIIEFVFLWLLVDIQNSFHGEAKDDLAAKIKNEYELGAKANDFSKFLNALMIEGSCCGSKGHEDFKNMTFKLRQESYEFTHSPACCTTKVWKKISSEVLGLEALANCVEQNMFYEAGCYDIIFDDASNSSGTLIVALLALLMMWEATLGGVAVCLMFRADAEADRKKESAIKQAEAEDLAEAIKEFTPYSQVSSFQSQNIERIKSTEIW